MAKKRDEALITLQSTQQALTELAVRVQMDEGKTDAWRHVVRATQHVTLALLHKLDPDAAELTAEGEKLQMLQQYGEGSCPRIPGDERLPIVKKAS